MKRGFTLIELMVSVSILSLGIVLIYQSFFTILNYFNYYLHYLDVYPWLNEKIWQIKEDLNRNGNFDFIEKGGFLEINKRIYRWNLDFSPIDKNLYAIYLTLFWQEGKREIRLFRKTYVFYRENNPA